MASEFKIGRYERRLRYFRLAPSPISTSAHRKQDRQNQFVENADHRGKVALGKFSNSAKTDQY
jgi:hypothetical protein